MHTSSFVLPAQTRNYLPNTFKVTTWKSLEPYYKELLRRPLQNIAQLTQWLYDRNELFIVFEDELNYRFTQLCTDTAREENRAYYEYALTHIQPRLKAFETKLTHRLFDTPLCEALPEDFAPLLQRLRTQHTHNPAPTLPLRVELQALRQQYYTHLARLRVQIDNTQLRLPEAELLLSHRDRNLRAKAFAQIQKAIQPQHAALDTLCSALIQKRHTLATQSGFENYKTYSDAQLCHQYSPTQKKRFRNHLKALLLPPLKQQLHNFQQRLHLHTLYPWDLLVEAHPEATRLKTKQLLVQTQQCLQDIHPSFGQHFAQLQKHKLIDWDGRQYKISSLRIASFHESNLSHISLNAVGTLQDLHKIFRATGYSLQRMLTQNISWHQLKTPTFATAELAARTLPLWSMHHWQTHFFKEAQTAQHAQQWQLRRIMPSLLRDLALDSFQEWLYMHPQHTAAARAQKWMEVHEEFATGMIDWHANPLALTQRWLWHSTLFTQPFSHFERCIAQLGALTLWQNYIQNPQKTLQQFVGAMQLGSSQSNAAIYNQAGSPYFFEAPQIEQLLQHLSEMLE